MRPNLQRRATGRPMLRTERDNGTYHVSATGAWYFQKKSTRQRLVPALNPKGLPVLDEHGKPMMRVAAIPEPWIRVTPKLERPGAVRRTWLRNTRPNHLNQ